MVLLTQNDQLRRKLSAYKLFQDFEKLRYGNFRSPARAIKEFPTLVLGNIFIDLIAQQSRKILKAFCSICMAVSVGLAITSVGYRSHSECNWGAFADNIVDAIDRHLILLNQSNKEWYRSQCLVGIMIGKHSQELSVN